MASKDIKEKVFEAKAIFEVEAVGETKGPTLGETEKWRPRNASEMRFFNQGYLKTFFIHTSHFL